MMSPWSLVAEQRKEVCRSPCGGGEYRCLTEAPDDGPSRGLIPAARSTPVSLDLPDCRMLMYMDGLMQYKCFCIYLRYYRNTQTTTEPQKFVALVFLCSIMPSAERDSPLLSLPP